MAGSLVEPHHHSEIGTDDNAVRSHRRQIKAALKLNCPEMTGCANGSMMLTPGSFPSLSPGTEIGKRFGLFQ